MLKIVYPSFSKLFTIFRSKRIRSPSVSMDYLQNSFSSSDDEVSSNNKNILKSNMFINNPNNHTLSPLLNISSSSYLSNLSSGSSSSSSSESDVDNSCIDSLELFKLSDDFEESEIILNQVGPDKYNDLVNIFSKSHENLCLMLKEINRETMDNDTIDGQIIPDKEWERCLCCKKTHTINDYKHIECIGKGGYGVVCKFINKSTQNICAIKTIKRDHLALKEINTLIELGKKDKQFTVNIFHTFLSPCKEKILIEMEYLEGGDCSYHLEDAGAFPEDIAKQYIAETVLCLEYIHNNSIVHGDIKPNNMAIDKEGHIKLLDFGSSKKFNQKKPTSTNGILGSPRYISPEVLLFEPQSPAVDFWALGVVLFELITGSTPFIGDTPEEIFDSILSRNTEEVIIPKDANDLITKLLDPNPATRIGSKDIKTHPYFNDIDWENLKSTPPSWKPKSTNNFICRGSCKLINSF
ncbi:hypothetical protein DICPUDRAFT_34584 [Dictyostelium purpureum]|uniref:non-specific serine/threonine protein kinase n=1 Tax=Dictyostelium purpureum TaxID=5786 RepID=F0ZMX4_DICPU|nr:uncharacterized protein DICPUDRAFT_34584 [Dictyostelium purpureum]EGC34683.1 hypothetical protein DICPUDRAFT_34584 [Dictyostelium purpureum]|eukprot:XP_003288768.1 hypothetical protein DICPUDRAFT_34584 [Dictyostelium purpureum]